MKFFSSLKTSDDCVLWNILTISGIRLKNASKKAKLFSKISVVFLLLSMIYALSLFTTFFVPGLKKDNSAYLLFNFLSFLLWYDLFRKRNKISNLLVRMYKLRKTLNLSNNMSCSIINVLPLIVVLLYILLCIFFIYTFKTADSASNFYSFNIEIRSNLARDILMGCGVFISFVLMFYVPNIASVAFSALEYRCSEMLTSYNGQLKHLLTRNRNNDPIYFAKLFTKLNDICEELKDILSLPLFLLIANNIIGLFLVLLSVIQKRFYNAAFSVEIITVFFNACVAILSQGVIGSSIPEKMEAIAKTAGKLAEKYRSVSTESKGVLFYLKKIEKKKVIYLTACNLFNFHRSFILQTLGAILNYGLLIVNLKIYVNYEEC